MSDRGSWIADCGIPLAHTGARSVNRQPSIRNPAVPPRAFTLLEVLIAIALVLTLMGTMFGFLFDMLHSRAVAHEYAARQRVASTLIDRLEADLTACVVGDSAVGGGVRGDESGIRILTRSVLASAAEMNVDDHEIFSDLQSADYRFIAESQRVEARRRSAGPQAGSSIGDSYLPLHDAGTLMPMVRFRYHDGREWRSSFDSFTEGRLPVAVEVAVWFTSLADDARAPATTAPAGPDRDAVQIEDDPRAKSGVFDDDAWARRRDRFESDDLPPDRVRVILIPDSGEGEDAAVEP